RKRMNALESLLAAFTQNAHRVDDAVDVRELRNPRFGPQIASEICLHLLGRVAHAAPCLDHAMASRPQCFGQMPPDESARARDEDDHWLGSVLDTCGTRSD